MQTQEVLMMTESKWDRAIITAWKWFLKIGLALERGEWRAVLAIKLSQRTTTQFHSFIHSSHASSSASWWSWLLLLSLCCLLLVSKTDCNCSWVSMDCRQYGQDVFIRGPLLHHSTMQSRWKTCWQLGSTKTVFPSCRSCRQMEQLTPCCSWSDDMESPKERTDTLECWSEETEFPIVVVVSFVGWCWCSCCSLLYRCFHWCKSCFSTGYTRRADDTDEGTNRRESLRENKV